MSKKGLEIEDLLYLFGRKKGKKNFGDAVTHARIQGENDWLDGLDRDQNPYFPETENYRQWDDQWRLMNQFC